MNLPSPDSGYSRLNEDLDIDLVWRKSPTKIKMLRDQVHVSPNSVLFDWTDFKLVLV